MKKLVVTSLLLAIVVIILGAYTRLTDAGLGCPDWPGCYGHFTVPSSAEHIEAAEQAFPERPLESHKAWNEMIHRYAASLLGLAILITFAVALRRRQGHHQTPVKLAGFLLLLVCFQGALGMWTVTMNLMPVVVMGHLLGGFTVLSCLFLMYLRLQRWRIPGGDIAIRKYSGIAMLGLLVVVVQIALGGWTSANYAAMACTEMPVCEGQWWQRLDFAGAFSIPEAHNYEFGAHDYDDRMTMHVLHRVGALITLIYLAVLAVLLWRKASSDTIKNQALLLLLVLSVQVALGVSNILFGVPLAVAVAHNAVGAMLLLVMVLINYTLLRKT